MRSIPRCTTFERRSAPCSSTVSRFHFHRPLDIGDSRMFFNAANVSLLGAAFRLDKFPENWVVALFATARRIYMKLETASQPVGVLYCLICEKYYIFHVIFSINIIKTFTTVNYIRQVRRTIREMLAPGLEWLRKGVSSC